MTQATALATQSDIAGNQTLVKGTGLAPLTRSELTFFGQLVHEAGLIPKEQNVTERQMEMRAMAKIVAGHSYGFDPILSMQCFDIINGRIKPTAECISILIKRSRRYNYNVVEWTNERCDLEFFAKTPEGGWNSLGHSVFTMEDAKRAGYTTGPNKHNYEKTPRNMLLARALTNGKKLYCADVMDPGGYVADGEDDFVPASKVDGEIVTTAAGDVVDIATGEVVEENNSSPSPQPSTEHKPAESSQAPTGDAAAAVGTLFAGTVETSEDEIREWIRSLARTKFGTDKDAYKEFLNGRNPTTMDRDSLIKLHGDLAAL